MTQETSAATEHTKVGRNKMSARSGITPPAPPLADATEPSILWHNAEERGLVDATEPNTSFTPPVPPPRARSRSPRMATQQEMARQMATLQVKERMRTLKWALASVDESISFSDDQELLEAYNQVKAGVKTLGKAMIKIAEATRFVDDSDEEPQQQQAELIIDEEPHTAILAERRRLLELDAERQRLQSQLIVLRAHRAQVIFLTVAQTLLSLPPTTADDAAATPPPPPALLPADPYPEDLPPPSRSAFRGRSRSPIGRVIANLNVLAGRTP